MRTMLIRAAARLLRPVVEEIQRQGREEVSARWAAARRGGVVRLPALFPGEIVIPDRDSGPTA